MDNIPEPVQVNQVPPVKPVGGMKAYLQKIKLILAPYLAKILAFFKVFWDQIPPKIRKIVIIIFSVLFALIFLLMIASLVMKQTKESKPLVLPTPEIAISPFPEDVISNPSRYATDSAVLKIEENLKSIEKTLNQMDIKESKLNPPGLDFKISFEE